MRTLLVTLALVGAAQARALQPLAAFVDSARSASVDARESQANLAVSDASHQLDIGHQLPSINLKGTYTRNQYGVYLPKAILDEFQGINPIPPADEQSSIAFTPFNQFDFYGTLAIPLVDVASFWRIRASGTARDAAISQTQAVQLQVEAQVVQDYYQLIANLALLDAAKKAQSVAEAARDVTLALVHSGRAPKLEEDRAIADVERQVQLRAQAELAVATSRRALQSASGLVPSVAGNEQPPTDDLHTEAAEASFAPPSEGTPALQAATLSLEASNRQAHAARLSLIPQLSGAFTEHVGNYVGFSGYEAAYQAVATLQWQIDFTTFANWKLQDAQAAAAEARRERTELAMNDAIHDNYAAVESALARSRSARAEADAAREAAALAKDRYQAGAAAQLDLLQADRDAFAAEASRIQADADLLNARVQLRLAAGRDPFAESNGGASR